MKVIAKFFLILAAIGGVISGCASKSDLDDIKKQIDSLKSSDQIQTISGQISSINSSLSSLETTDTELKGYIETLQGQAESLEKTGKDLDDAITQAKGDLEGEISASESKVLGQLETLKGSVDSELGAIKKAIGDLQDKDEDLQKRIDSLKVYAETQIGEIKDWAEVTSATLKEYNKTAEIVAGIPAQIESIISEISEIKNNIPDVQTAIDDAVSGLKTELQGETDEAVAALKAELLTKIKDASDNAADAIESATDDITNAYKTAISGAIDASEKSMKTWINEQLTGYYTISQMDSKLKILDDKLDTQKKDLKTLIEQNAKDIDNLEGLINTNKSAISDLKNSLATQKTDITTAYTAAIEAAVENQGTINKTVQDTLAKHNTRLIALDSKVTQCETDIAAIKDEITKIKTDIANLQKDVNSLLSRIQSITYIPKYSDGIERMEYDASTATATDLTLRFDVRPADCADSIVKAYENYLKDTKLASPISARAVYTLTKAAAGDFVDLKIKSVTAEKDQSTNKSTGVISVTISPSDLGNEFFQGTLGASLVLNVSTGSTDIQSDYIRLALSGAENAPTSNYYSTIPFTIKSLGSTTVSLVKEGSPADITLEYRKNAEDWTAYSIGTAIELANGNTLQFRAGEKGNSAFSTNGRHNYHFNVTGTGNIMVYGNIMSLMDRTLTVTSVPDRYFFSLFLNVTKLVDASNLQLPATKLSKYCYSCMFSGCSNLTAAPELPATALATYCYASMFEKCTSLIVAPKLPATELAEKCYSAMFWGCSRLSNVEAMFKNTPEEKDDDNNPAYTYEWLYGVSPTGVFIKNKDATWDVTGVYAVPSGWTVLTE